MDPFDHFISRIHQQRNRITRDDRDSFQSHRENVTNIVASACRPDQTLLILGAGNGNDLDLDQLVANAKSVTLADLDTEAVDHCVAGYSAETRDQISVVAPVDVSGVIGHLPDRKTLNASLADAIEIAKHPDVSSLQPSDVVVSTCLISQLIDSVHQSVDESHPQYLEFVLAVRDGHLDALRRLTKSGGTAVLITDFVSSDTLAELSTADQQDLLSLLTTAVQQRNFFTGLNPAVLIQKLSVDTPLPPESIHPPWRWQLGPRTYGVIAIETSWG